MQLVVGRITRPHGVRGELSVEVRTDEPDRRFAAGHVLATDPVTAGPLTVESVRWHSGRLLVQFAGITDRNQAEDLRGVWLTLDSAEAGPSDDPDEFHDAELIGLAVVTTSGEPVGRVKDVRHFGQDLLVIEPGPGGSQARPGQDAPDHAESAQAGPVPTGGPARALARLAPCWRAAGGHVGHPDMSCWSRSWPRSCPKSTWPRAGSLSTRRPGCSSWLPGNRIRPVRQEAEVSRVRIDIITIFPDYFAPLSVSLLGKAASRGDIDLQVHDLRTWAHGVHRAVDDAPFGGGPGMVMSPEPWGEALDAVTGPGPAPARLVVPTPAGVPFTQAMAAEWARCGWLVFACGRYEGIDARVVDEARDRMPVDEVSIGDYVLSGGEPAVLVMVDAVGRLLPGVLGNADSAADDSFGAGEGPMAGLLEGPAYTRPRVWRGREVPPVLLSGDHAAIARWRRDQALRRTAALRPDLAARLAAGEAGTRLDARDRQVLLEAGFPISAEDMAH